MPKSLPTPKKVALNLSKQSMLPRIMLTIEASLLWKVVSF